MLRFLFAGIISILASNATLFASESIHDPTIEEALNRVVSSNSISPTTCLENIQVLIRSAIKQNADLAEAKVVVFYSPGDFLYPEESRWPQVPHYDFHVILMKEGWVYDFAATPRTQPSKIYQAKDYFSIFFSKNKLSELRFKVVPALELLMPEHRKLPMDDHDTYSFIRKVWKQNGRDYKKIAFGGDEVTFKELVAR